MKRLNWLFLLLIANNLTAQITFPENGVADERPAVYQLKNATVYVTADRKVENATLTIKDGKVASVNAGVSNISGAQVIDMKGKIIYPSFIDIYSSYGLKKPDGKKNDPGPQFLSSKTGAYGWNEAIKPEISAHELFKSNESAAEKLRNLGFGVVSSHVPDGICRGTSVLVSLADETENETILKEKSAAHFSFKKGTSTQDFPGSLMGAISLIRQTYMDSKWYSSYGRKEEVNLSLEAFNELRNLPQIFEARDHLTGFRADKVGDEFGIQYIIRGSGDEYQRVEAVKNTGAMYILPLKYPDAPDVSDPFLARAVSLKSLKHWETAPANAAILKDAGVNFCFTLNGLEDKNSLHKQIKKAIEYGLDEADALRALTISPARAINAQDMIGSLENGKLANFIITDSDLFSDDASIIENWVQGKRYIIESEESLDVNGDYDLKVNGETYALNISGSPADTQFKIDINDSTEVKVKSTIKDGNITLNFNPDAEISNNTYRLGGWKQDATLKGSAQLPDGKWTTWTATKVDRVKAEKSDKEEADSEETKAESSDDEEDELYGDIVYPFMAYGWSEAPKQESVLIKNVTVWTNEDDGILEESDVLISNGKIRSVGKSLGGADREIDGTDLHITAGLIDEHSHICISRGVNEWAQASSAEVRIGDVINSEDINIYRQLAGGVTTSQLLHGSANPIGGQSAIIKLRWGASPENMKFQDAPGFIKFALGENVKQSNWGEYNTIRFPQTRMGVEQVFEDHFTRALEYEKAGAEKRPDLELEALLEIIRKKRFITCHSYVQSEITMLMRVAERYGFKVNTFTHILEGYKIADKMHAHGCNASTFSDWWQYKYEVIDAIPHNAAILSDMKVNTAINSDDAEMGRRLNQEAAKSVKYGAMTEEEALKMVTLNPAKMLHLDDKIGSIKSGKDADLVIWSGHPLSVYSKALFTFVDGVCYYDHEKDAEMKVALQKERSRIIQKILDDGSSSGKKKGGPSKKQLQWHCDTILDDY